MLEPSGLYGIIPVLVIAVVVVIVVVVVVVVVVNVTVVVVHSVAAFVFAVIVVVAFFVVHSLNSRILPATSRHSSRSCPHWKHKMVHHPLENSRCGSCHL